MELKDQIREQGEALRKLKANNPEWHTEKKILDHIWNLLNLKSKDPALNEEVFGTDKPAKQIKIRWYVVDGKKNKIRYQNVFKGRTFVTGKEVIASINSYMHHLAEKKKDQLPKHVTGDFVKIEHVSRPVAKAAKVLRSVTEEDMFRLPAVFPGPTLLPETIIEFKVTFPGPAYHLTTPEAYNLHRPEIVDAGVNLFEKVLCKNVDAVIARSFAAGVSQSVLISIDAQTSATSVGICKKHLQSLYATAGVHPLYIGNAPASRGDDEEKKQIEEDEKALQPVQFEGAEVKPEENNNNNEKPKEKDLKTELNAITALIKHNPEYIVAVGEIGLDFKDNLAPELREQQKVWFEEQLKLAAELKLPVLIHEREAFKETIEMLRKYRSQLPTVVINCFTGTQEEMVAYNELDAYFVITGIVANTIRASHLKDVVKNMPIKKILLGSDAPYLTPFNMPKPFPRRNEPGFLPHVLVGVAEACGQSLESMAAITTENSRQAFNMARTAYSGVLRAKPEIVHLEVQKLEDEKLRAAEENKLKSKKKKVKTVTIQLKEGQEVFEFEGKKYIVSQKEKSVLEKQAKILASDMLMQLIKDFEAPQVPENAVVVPAKNAAPALAAKK